MSFCPGDRGNSAPPDPLAGFEGPLREGGERGKRGERDGRDERKHPK